MTISAAHSRRLSESASASARFLSCGDGAVYVRAACVIVCACDSACSSQQRRPSPRLASRRGHTVPGRLRHHAHVRSRKSCACVEEVGVSGCSLACLLRRWSYPDVSSYAQAVRGGATRRAERGRRRRERPTRRRKRRRGRGRPRKGPGDEEREEETQKRKAPRKGKTTERGPETQSGRRGKQKKATKRRRRTTPEAKNRRRTKKKQQPALNCAADTFPGAAAVGAAHSSPPPPGPPGLRGGGGREERRQEGEYR